MASEQATDPGVPGAVGTHCPDCGAVVGADDYFCSSCGALIGRAAHSAVAAVPRGAAITGLAVGAIVLLFVVGLALAIASVSARGNEVRYSGPSAGVSGMTDTNGCVAEGWHFGAGVSSYRAIHNGLLPPSNGTTAQVAIVLVEERFLASSLLRYSAPGIAGHAWQYDPATGAVDVSGC